MQTLTATVLTIGDELLYGSIVDTNAAYLGQRLTELGIEPVLGLTVGDEAERIRRALEIATYRTDVVLVTGGLGPTHDDVTKAVIAEVTGQRLIFHQDILDGIEQMFIRRGMTMPESNRIQAFIPEQATVLDNPVGTAPGFTLTHQRAVIFVMPGVPREMKVMMTDQVIPRLRERAGGRVIVHRMLKTTGVGESTLFEMIREFISSAPDIRVASLPQESGVSLRRPVQAASADEARSRIGALEEKLTERIGSYLYGTDDETLEQAVGRLLIEARATVSVAESCTGGLVLDRLTDVPGSSAYVDRGLVAYSNEAKMKHLGVPEETLKTYGAVSAETAAKMAEGMRRVSGSTFALSTTGVAGPGGATPDKPVGLVYIGLAHEHGVITRELRLGTDRRLNKVRAAIAGLNLLRLQLLGKVDPG